MLHFRAFIASYHTTFSGVDTRVSTIIVIANKPGIVYKCTNWINGHFAIPKATLDMRWADILVLFKPRRFNEHYGLLSIDLFTGLEEMINVQWLTAIRELIEGRNLIFCLVLGFVFGTLLLL